MLIGISKFLEYLLLFRFVWIRGTLGGGKTLLSVALAEQLLRMGMVDGVVANLPTVLPPSLGPDDGLITRRCVVFDEAWTQVDSRRSLVNDTTTYGGFARKLESYWLMPSVYPVDKRLRPLIVERTARIGFAHLWVYRWRLELDYMEEGQGGVFFLYKPELYFDKYDSKHIPVDDGGISGRWLRTVYQMTKGQGVEVGLRISEYLRGLALVAGVADVE